MAHASHRPDVVCGASESASRMAGGASSHPVSVPANVVGLVLTATGSSSSNGGYFVSTPLAPMSVAWLVTDTSTYAQARRRASSRHAARLRSRRHLLHNAYLQKFPRDAYVFYHNRRMYAHPTVGPCCR